MTTKKATKKAEQVDYFTLLIYASKELDKLAAPYLVGREDKSIDDLAQENYDLGLKRFKEADEDWDAVHWTISNIADGNVPYSRPSHRNGSLNYLMGFSLVSLEAHAWVLNDFLRGKIDSPDLPFELVAKVTDEEDIKPKKKRTAKSI